MFLVNNEQVKALSDRIRAADNLAACKTEVEKMLEIKSTLLWRAEAACGCVGSGLANSLYTEVQMLEDVLDAVVGGETDRGSSVLDEYMDMMI